MTQEQLRRRFRQATLAFARRARQVARPNGALAPLARLVTVEPSCEDAHVLLIETYEALGDRTRAAAAYQRYQAIVRGDLRGSPRPALARRFERIRPWFGGRPYFTPAIVDAQRRAAPAAELLIAHESDHSTLVRDPEPAVVDVIRAFIERCRPRARRR